MRPGRKLTALFNSAILRIFPDQAEQGGGQSKTRKKAEGAAGWKGKTERGIPAAQGYNTLWKIVRSSSATDGVLRDKPRVAGTANHVR